VGISSAASMQGNKSEVAYCASKGALDAAVRAMAKELAPKKIRVNTINPAYIKTELVDGIISMVGNNSSFESRLERQYLGVIEPENVANLVAFILSQASAFITGSSVAIDGGRLSS
jgi:NAD(P)-dependent dehydrogenase (short-subunit alcohol dehydrogenase family)